MELTEHHSGKRYNNARMNILALFLIILVGLSSYSNTFKSSFHFDDIYSIVENNGIRDISSPDFFKHLPTRRFVTFFSLAINYHFDGLNPFGYHLFNLITHLLTSILVYCFMKLMLESSLKRERINILSDHKILSVTSCWMISLFAALLFVSHPIQTQAVTYIIQRSASITTFFYLLSIYFYFKFASLRSEGGRPGSYKGI